MELRETRLENKRVRDKKENKGVAEYFGTNHAHMLNLVQVTDSKDLPPVWVILARAYQTGGASLESFMDQFQQVRKVCAEVLRRALVILLVPDPLVL